MASSSSRVVVRGSPWRWMVFNWYSSYHREIYSHIVDHLSHWHIILAYPDESPLLIILMDFFFLFYFHFLFFSTILVVNRQELLFGWRSTHRHFSIYEVFSFSFSFIFSIRRPWLSGVEHHTRRIVVDADGEMSELKFKHVINEVVKKYITRCLLKLLSTAFLNSMFSQVKYVPRWVSFSAVAAARIDGMSGRNGYSGATFWSFECFSMSPEWKDWEAEMTNQATWTKVVLNW